MSDDIRMAEAGEHGPFFFEQLDRRGVGITKHRFQGHEPFGDRVVGFVDDAHAALADGRVADLIAAVQIRRGEGGSFRHADTLREILDSHRRRGSGKSGPVFFRARPRICLGKMWTYSH